MEKYNSFRPGVVWLDTNGKRIQAHGGSVIYIDGVYYFYGENKEKTDGKNGIWHWGVKCYSSKDLYNWTDLGIIIPPDLTDETSPLHPSSCMDRPHIIYQKKRLSILLLLMARIKMSLYRLCPECIYHWITCWPVKSWIKWVQDCCKPILPDWNILNL